MAITGIPRVDGLLWVRAVWMVIDDPHPFGEISITDQSFWLPQQGYLEECEEPRGKGSFPAMITPAYQNAKKANELASDVSTTWWEDSQSHREGRREMKGDLQAAFTEICTQIHLLELNQSRM